METPINNNQLVKVDRAATVPALQLSKAEFLKNFSPVKCLKQFQSDNAPLTCANHTDLPSIVDIKLQYGDDYLIGYLKLWIINCFEYFGVKPPDGDRLEEAVLLCTENRQYLNLSDINLIFGNIKRKYMDISLQKIRKAFEDYADERAAAFYDNQLHSDDVIKKHGYMPKEMSESETLKRLNETVIEYQMQAAEREAHLELVELNQNYRLSEAIKHFKQNA